MLSDIQFVEWVTKYKGSFQKNLTTQVYFKLIMINKFGNWAVIAELDIYSEKNCYTVSELVELVHLI